MGNQSGGFDFMDTGIQQDNTQQDNTQQDNTQQDSIKEAREAIDGFCKGALGHTPDVVFNGLKAYGPEIRSLITSISKAHVDVKIAAVQQFQKAGFSKEEAILLTIDCNIALQNATKAYNKK